MPQQMGFVHFWIQGDAVSHATAILLALLSILSWYVIVGKAIWYLRYRLSQERALNAFWQAESLHAALEEACRYDRSGIFHRVALAGALAAQAYQRQAASDIGGVNSNNFVTRALRQGIVEAQAHIEQGLTFLASVGATAPFIGLFGTVWGIYHALVGLSGASQVVLDKVAGPVGEALIMTAAGLFVAIPAVLAYNASARANRLVLAQLDGFAHDLHAYLTTGIRPQSGASLVDFTPANCARVA